MRTLIISEANNGWVVQEIDKPGSAHVARSQDEVFSILENMMKRPQASVVEFKDAR